MVFQLIKDQKPISNIKCSQENGTFNCTPAHELILPQKSKDKLLKFILNDSSRGVYRCEGEIVFPPPYRKVESEVSIQVVETGKHSHKVLTAEVLKAFGSFSVAEHDVNMLLPGCHCDCTESSRSQFLWIWIIVTVLLIIYGLTVTIAAFVLWVRYSCT